MSFPIPINRPNIKIVINELNIIFVISHSKRRFLSIRSPWTATLILNNNWLLFNVIMRLIVKLNNKWITISSLIHYWTKFLVRIKLGPIQDHFEPLPGSPGLPGNTVSRWPNRDKQYCVWEKVIWIFKYLFVKNVTILQFLKVFSEFRFSNISFHIG